MNQSRVDRYTSLLQWGENLVADSVAQELIAQPPIGNSGRGPDFLAYAEWTLHQLTALPRHAAAAHRLIVGPRKHWMANQSYHRQATLLDEFCHYPFGYVYTGLREAGRLTADDERTAKEFLEGSLRFWMEYPSYFCGTTELDMGNLGLTAACGADYAGRHIFTGDFGASLRAFGDKVWNGYWAVGDCPEDATNYEILHFVYMPLWAALRGEMPAVQEYVRNGAYERTLQQILPLGAPLDQGDGFWMSGWEGWIASFEIAAKITRDGRFAWAAQRILDYLLASGYRAATEDGVRRAKAGEARYLSSVTSLPQNLFFLAVAAQWTDESVVPVEPQGHTSTITYRSYVSLPDAWEQSPLGGGSAGMTMFPHGHGERREDKLIVRSGYSADANCLIAGLDQKAYHDHDDSGGILGWVNKGQVLLHGCGYHQRNLNAQNVLYVRPRSVNVAEELGQTYLSRGASYPRNRCTMDFIEDLSAVTFARFKSVHLCGLDATWQRTLIVPRDGACVAVLDEIASRSDDVWAAPLWHTQNVHEQGSHWADTDQGELWHFPNVSWSQQTQRLLISAPLGDSLQRIRQDNPDLEPRPTINMSREDRLRMWGQQECLYQLGDVKPGGRNWFLTLLLPHEPGVTGAAMAARIRVLAQEPSRELPPGSPPAWCLEITDEAGHKHLVGMVPPRLPTFYNVPKPDHHGYQASWVKTKDFGDPHADRSKWFTVKDGDKTVLTTDAEIFHVRQAGDRTEIAVRHMRNLEYAGLQHHAGISPCWAPTRLQVNGEFALQAGKNVARYACRNFSPLELSFGSAPKSVKVTGGVNGIASTVEVAGATLRVGLNGRAEIEASA